MSTFGELISKVTNGLNANVKDSRISKRYILSVLKDVGKFLISQKFRDKTLYRNTNVFTTLNCIKMVPKKGNECGIPEFNSCKQVMVSKKPLPEIMNTRFGPAIIGIYNIDNSKSLDLITLSKFNNIKSNKNYNLFKGSYAYIHNNHLYIPDSEWKMINMDVLTIDDEYEDVSDCKDSGCKSGYDVEFPLPDSIAVAVVQETIKQVSLKLNIPVDENTNLDSNQKSASVQ